jgi:outer membrane protein TolC
MYHPFSACEPLARAARLAGIAWLVLAAGLPSTLLAQTLTLPQAVRETLAHNQSLRAAASSVREADARVRQARSPLFPRVSVTESWQRGDQPVFVFSSLLSSRRFTAANFAIESLNFPEPVGFFRGALSVEQVVFDGGRTGASAESAVLQRDMTSLSADEAGASLAVTTTEAYGRVLTAHAATLAADAAIATAQEDLTRAT